MDPQWLGLSDLTLRTDCVHHLDVCRFLFGEPEWVFATSWRNPGQLPRGDTTVHIALRYSDTLGATIRSNGEKAIGEDWARWRVEASEGIASGTYAQYTHYGLPVPDEFEVVLAAHPSCVFRPALPYTVIPHAFIATMAQLLIAVESGAEAETSGRDNLETMRLIEAAARSISRAAGRQTRGDRVPRRDGHRMTAIARIEAHVEERPHREVFEGAFGGRSSSLVVEVELWTAASGWARRRCYPAGPANRPRRRCFCSSTSWAPRSSVLDAAGVAEAARVALAANNFLVWAVEAAALDALGARAAAKPVPVRGLIGRVGPETASRLACLQTGEGHRRLKVKLAGGRAEDEARLRAVREAAPDATIVADANESIAWEELPAYGAIFAVTSVDGVEQPCPRIDVLERGLPEPDGWTWVADESIWGYEDALTLRDGPWQAWTLHPGKCRGEDILGRVAEVAADRGIAVVLGSNAEFGPGAAALCRVAAGLPDLDLQLLLGHDLAGPLLVEGWSADGLELAGDEIRWKEAA